MLEINLQDLFNKSKSPPKLNCGDFSGAICGNLYRKYNKS